MLGLRGKHTRALILLTGLIIVVFAYRLVLELWTRPTVDAFALQTEINERIQPVFEQFVDPVPKVISTNVKYPESAPPRWGPFDPRFTFLVVLDKLAKQDEAGEPRRLDEFHWADYVNVDALFEYGPARCSDFDQRTHDEKKDKYWPIYDPERYCIDTDEPIDKHGLFKPGYRINSTLGRSTEEMKRVQGKSYLVSTMPPPHLINMMLGQHMIQVPVNPDAKREQLIYTLSDEELTRERDLTEQLNKLREGFPEDYGSIQYEVPLEHSDFIDPSLRLIEELEAKEAELNSSDYAYLEAIRTQPGWVPKHFSELVILKDIPGYTYGSHYDWRFFNVLLGPLVQQVVLRGLVQSWLKFCRINGFRSWLAHGTLLSWYWNAAPFPWDIDVDVQMPIADLHRLARNFNALMIVDFGQDRPRYGRYYLDVGTSLNQRTKGNGLNNIDARFIDMDTGAYIDITALAKTPLKPPKSHRGRFQDTTYNCRNNHFVSLQELHPLRLTLYEGELTYVPLNPHSVLTEEYKAKLMEVRGFMNHVYVLAYGLWVPEETWSEFVEAIPEERKDLDHIISSRKDYLRLLHPGINDEKLQKKLDEMAYPISKLRLVDNYVEYLSSQFNLLQTYLAQYNLTHFHTKEMELLNKGYLTRHLYFDGQHFRKEVTTLGRKLGSDHYTVLTNLDGTDSLENKLDRLNRLLDRWSSID